MEHDALNHDAALAAFCLHLGDALADADRIEQALYSRSLLDRIERHALKALSPEFVRRHWDVLAPAMSIVATTLAGAAEPTTGRLA